jgi:hypothetical protein
MYITWKLGTINTCTGKEAGKLFSDTTDKDNEDIDPRYCYHYRYSNADLLRICKSTSITEYIEIIQARYIIIKTITVWYSMKEAKKDAFKEAKKYCLPWTNDYQNNKTSKISQIFRVSRFLFSVSV